MIGCVEKKECLFAALGKNRLIFEAPEHCLQQPPLDRIIVDNKWLIAAVALSLLTHMLVIYVPFLQTAFHTVALTWFDWAVATAVAATLLIIVELTKLAMGSSSRSVTPGRIPVTAPGE